MRRFIITTLGCKVNQYDSQAVAAALGQAGLVSAEPPETPDLVVINTCCVTTSAIRKSRQLIRRAVRNAPGAAVFVLGCYSNYHARRIREILDSLDVPPRRSLIAGHHDDLPAAISRMLEGGALLNKTTEAGKSCNPGRKVLPHHGSRLDAPPDKTSQAPVNKADIPGIIENIPSTIKARRLAALSAFAEKKSSGQNMPPIERFTGHRRAFVKVQDGCDAFCSYCIVPYTRPRVWSKSIEQVERECRTLVAAGHREIVLCGIFLGAFGQESTIRRRWDRPGRLPELLRRIAGIEGLWRLRLSSLEVGDLSEQLLATMSELPNFAPHLHLPLQSGSQRILQKMNRQYSAEEYRHKVRQAKEILDRPAITTDIIVGFPTADEQDFARTLELAEECGFPKIHAFAFSAVQPTAAWRHRSEAPPRRVVQQRMERLTALEAELAQRYRRGFIGEVMEGLIETTPSPAGPDHTAAQRAMTDRYITVEFTPPSQLAAGQIVPLKIESTTNLGLRGKII